MSLQRWGGGDRQSAYAKASCSAQTCRLGQVSAPVSGAAEQVDPGAVLRHQAEIRSGPAQHQGRLQQLCRQGAPQPRRAASIFATSIFLMSIIASNARLASPPPAAIASVSVRGVICQDTPHLSLHQPQALS